MCATHSHGSTPMQERGIKWTRDDSVAAIRQEIQRELSVEHTAFESAASANFARHSLGQSQCGHGTNKAWNVVAASGDEVHCGNLIRAGKSCESTALAGQKLRWHWSRKR